ncbi:MAG: response regulator [Candidatus Nomurabacteria bacterium]|nr:MAG: response regulator [Candidatus Nomurabacteria bacterium]
MQKTVLIIEDEADVREAMADAVSEAGFQVNVANNGEAGLKMAIEKKPDLILLDIIMPVMDGHETLKRLRRDPWGRNAKVIVLTAMDDVTNVASAHTSDITDYIIKTQSSLEDIVKKVRLELV